MYNIINILVTSKAYVYHLTFNLFTKLIKVNKFELFKFNVPIP